MVGEFRMDRAQSKFHPMLHSAQASPDNFLARARGVAERSGCVIDHPRSNVPQLGHDVARETHGIEATTTHEEQLDAGGEGSDLVHDVCHVEILLVANPNQHVGLIARIRQHSKLEEFFHAVCGEKMEELRCSPCRVFTGSNHGNPPRRLDKGIEMHACPTQGLLRRIEAVLRHAQVLYCGLIVRRGGPHKTGKLCQEVRGVLNHAHETLATEQHSV
ncbi:MAG: hypothetical protein GY772_19470 [bacterium]|nr:hypothetical protein [bacterium]